MAERKIAVEVEDLYKIYKVGTTKVRALNGVSFQVYEGEFCAIVGTSGSGKSTLLNMLAGLEHPTKGQIAIRGRHIEKMNENQLVAFRREHVGFIFQSFNLMGTMNAIENVALPLSFRGVPKKERMKQAERMIRLVGMARALVLNPDIVFADEPTGNLDSVTSEEMMNLMRNVVSKHHKTLIMVTHDNQLASYADRIIHIKDGKIIEIEDNTEKWKSSVGNVAGGEE